ncbi:beta-ketoacyl synthase N-terminal-like domain-containing protein [Flavobacterium sp. Fl-77]|uniref:Beta-ketoacyl synthase N-terminal-like domain-containing protein n=1 Tax=Flavobacterium flavipigmentatum TaxID=2893884 RepID=A0AAJ2S6V9_9FLAO|nr:MULTISPECIES: beta-ketoacyl synthase N-terminal-like domain-containing protein [unclassified Flavobacterium]MDX6181036.1 beta-ketoacyl synthase N-terminal-like domain-containing protein [Flavobacterium sp. Fl-33]MDX6184637.1 beta-ketoacyl synthase N-terminal-like domain-containing protein [Flavobacterium sp. Fl-77]UFH39739.1 beta-ketoacyl synthase chain length factor [Flavobacterium sp. F-70]
MKKTYINGVGCISTQKTFDTVFLEEAVYNQKDTVFTLVKPEYKEYVSLAASRRMAKGVKNGIVASALAMKDSNTEKVDAIITGTGMGCIEDSDRFLKNILDNNEEFLTPTSFIQSTHNTVGAQIALLMQCKGYNFTYVNGVVSFESALLDAKLQIEEEEAQSILVGGIDENTDYTMSLYKLAGFVKNDQETPFDLLKETSTGVVYGEGASFFVLENERKESTYAQILDVEIINSLEENEVETEILAFLKANNLQISDIDAVVLGFNGDATFDSYYKNLARNTFAQTPQLYYKHLSGEFNTASAFGLWMASKVIQTQEIPEIIKVNAAEKPAYNTILLYNQYKGKNHSFTLLSK